MEKLPVNKYFFIQFFENYFNNKRENITALDYGCGNGDIVKSAIEKGYKFYGIENFYGMDKNYIDNLKFKCKIDLVKSDGTTPYEDNYFDYIFSNQVFEHVQNLELVLKELQRILKPGGVMVHSFPVKEYLMEGHILIPFFHWLPREYYFRRLYTKFFIKLGLGNIWISDDVDKNIDSWIDFVDNKCFYRSEKEIVKQFKEFFSVEYYNKEKLLYHLSKKNNKIYRILYKFFKTIPSFVVDKIVKRRGSITLFCIKNKG